MPRYRKVRDRKIDKLQHDHEQKSSFYNILNVYIDNCNCKQGYVSNDVFFKTLKKFNKESK